LAHRQRFAGGGGVLAVATSGTISMPGALSWANSQSAAHSSAFQGAVGRAQRGEAGLDYEQLTTLDREVVEQATGLVGGHDAVSVGA